MVQTRVNIQWCFGKTCGHFSWLSPRFFARRDCLSLCIHFLNAKKSRNRNAISLCQSKNFLTTRHVAGSFPCRQSGSRDAGQSGRLVLGQLCFPSEVMQPSSVGISPCFWFSSHAAARINCEIGGFSVLSRFRQNMKLVVDGKRASANMSGKGSLAVFCSKNKTDEIENTRL